ncbi:hypothetical protein [Microbulbifer sp. TRSA005]|uniref:hypothetical protein n=1 Tax=Microbulbifer sp. TRSA005 TaxID=3243383 RepID=UPI0040390E38
MKIMKRVTLCAGISLVAANASANELSGACYDYASREASSAVSYDGQSVGILLANNVISTALGVPESFSLISKAYPFIYSAVKGGVVEKMTPGADPQLVSCLEEFNSRISNLEGAYLGQDLTDLTGLVSLIQQEIVDNGILSSHANIASKLQLLAVSLGEKIDKELDADTPTSAKYKALIDEVIPGYIAIIQMEFMHRKEWNRYCYNRGSYASWKNVEDDELISPSILNSIKHDDEVVLTDYLIEPEDALDACRGGNDTYLTYNRVKDVNEIGSYKKILDDVGIKVNENNLFPGLVSVELDFRESRLGAYRESFVRECSGGGVRYSYIDNYNNFTSQAVPESQCNQWRDEYIDDLYSNSQFASESKRNSIFHSLAFIVDSWDWYNHALKITDAQADEDLIEIKDVFDLETYRGVRLKYKSTDKCASMDGTVKLNCDVGASQFMIRPYQDGYTISRLADNRNFKDKGEDSDGFVIRSSVGSDSVWQFKKRHFLDTEYQIVNSNTERCLIVDENDRLIMGGCENDDRWEIDGTDIPEGTFIRLRHVPDNTCFGRFGAINCDEESYVFEVAKYQDGYRITVDSRSLKQKDDGLGFYSGLGDDAIWVINDFDGDGLFRLANYTTGHCLSNENGVLTTVACGIAPSDIEIFALEFIELPTAASGNHTIIAPEGLTGFNGCISSFHSASSTFPAGYRGSNLSCQIALLPHNGGYLIWDTEANNESYVSDIDLGFGHHSIRPDTEKTDATTWDFIGPYRFSDDSSFYQIKNRLTGHCLAPQFQNAPNWLVGKVDCEDNSSKVWTIKEDSFSDGE